jgi:hypothetical protein
MAFDSTCVGVANSALTLVGSRLLVAYNDASKEQKLISTNWDIYRKAVLRDAFWKFATKRAVLTQDTNYSGVFGYSNKFYLPTDFIRLRAINDTDMAMSPDVAPPYRIENSLLADGTTPGNALLTDMAYANVRYIYDCSTVPLFDPLFVQAFAAYIASQICFSLTASESERTNLEAMYQKARRKAMFVDSAEDPSEVMDNDIWLASRVGAGGFVRDPGT